MPRPPEKKLREIYEQPLGSGNWWIQYFDASGRRRREKAGRRGDAIDLLAKRKTEKLRGSRDWFEPTVEAAGVKEYTWHCNRHTFASRLVMAGVDLRTVAQLMGHRTIQMTMRYAHLATDHQQNAVERLVKSGNGAESRRRQSATKTATTSGDRP